MSKVDVHRTDRYWGTIGLSGFFAALAVVFAEPLFLPVGVILLAWTLTLEMVFRARVRDIANALSVSQSLSQATVRPEQTFESTATVQFTETITVPLTLRPQYPEYALGASATRSHTLSSGDKETTIQERLRLPFAGNYTIGPVTATVESTYGFFEATLETTDTATVTVEPQQPNDMHVGQAGDRFAVTFGEHGSGNTGPGMVPAGVRAYTPGDPASRINWKATARLDDVYVREFEIETIRPLAIILDGRATPSPSTRDDPAEYRRHIAAALINEARSHGDPVGLYYVTADGVEAPRRLSSSPEQFLQIRNRLYQAGSAAEARNEAGTAESTTPALEMRVAASRVQRDASAFGTQLAPFLTAPTERVQPISGEPLTETVRTYLKRQSQDVRVAILTDDQHRAELYEATKVAGQLSTEVLAFITPTALFEADDVSAIDNVYSRYTDFERFRTQVDRGENVTAFEVAPGDKLQTILTRKQAPTQ